MRYTISFVLLAAATGFSQVSTGPAGLPEPSGTRDQPAESGSVVRASSLEEQRSLPAFFIPNFGQTDPSVRFMVNTPEVRAGFTAGSAIFQLDRLTLRVRFAGANAQAAIEGVERLTAQANFLIGNRPQDWLTNLPVYEKILYRELYPGIDVSYGGAGRGIKSEFLVAPGADPHQIRLDYSGATLSIAPNGSLLIRSGDIEAMEAAPFIYQENGGQETGGQETGGQETGGQETGGQDTGGQETGGQEPGGQEISGQEIGGQETGGQETGGGQEAGGQEIGGQEIGGQEIGGQETGGREAGGQETGGQEPGGHEAASQGAAAGRVEIPGRYLLLDAHTVGFEIAAYDRSRPLIIDPVLSYATYLGGSGNGAVSGVAVDSSGDLYVTGWTESLNFQIAGPIQASNGGDVDAFVAKLSPAGSGLVYATYIGGNGDDQGTAIAVDSTGEAYVTGSTGSSNFPVVAAFQPTLAGGRDAFALKINALGSLLVYSTYLGGVNNDTGNAIAVDSSDNAYIAGDTQSANFPVLSAEQPVFGGNQNAFLTKLSSAGAKAFSTFLGGWGFDHAGGIALDSTNNIYIAGGTTSTNFPVLGAIQAVNGGGQDAFLTKINAAGSAIVYSTYLGGTGGDAQNPEEANAVAVDSSGNAYIAGTTNSTNFPVTAGAFQASFSAVQDAFAAKVNPAGNALVYSSYLGGSAFNWANGIVVLASGVAYVAGYTSSFDFPVVVPVQASFGGLYDAFISVFNVAGNSLSFSTFYGGSGSDEANAIAVDASGNMYFGGQTNSLNLPLLNPIQATNAGFALPWSARLGVTSAPPQLPAVVSLSPVSGNGNTATFTAKFSDPAGISALASVTLLVNTTASPNYGCQVTYLVAANQFALANDVASSGSTRVNPGGGNAQNDQCTLSGSGSYVTTAGNILTVYISVAFQAGFTGSDTVYLSAVDTSGNTTALVSSGIWTATVPPPQPTASSVSPNASMGSSQTFTFVFSDTQNPLNITGMAMLFNTSVTFSSACYIIVDRVEGTIALAYDSGLGSSSRPFSSTTPIANSQCTLGAATITISGLSDILTVALTFTGSFSGLKNIYMFGSENGVYETGWVQMGTYDVAVGGIPLATSVSPSSGAGPSQRFSFTVTDQGGAGFLTGLSALISTSLSTTGTCYVLYDRNAGTLSLAYDTPANGASAVTPGSTQVVSNSQCTLKASDSTVVIGVTSMVVTVDLTFNADYFGAKNIYLDAIELGGVTSGWTTVGSWTVTGGAPEANSVSPSSGSGAVPVFLFTVSDSTSSLNIVGMTMLITSGSPANTANACYLVYAAGAGTIGLYNNAGTVSSSKAIGSASTLSNSQCAVGYTLAYSSGNSVILQVDLSFTGTFTAPQTVYLDALEPAASSGWVAVGTWTP